MGVNLDDWTALVREADGNLILHPDVPGVSVINKATPTNTAQGAAGLWGLTPDYLSFRNTWFGQPQPVAYKMLWKAFLEDPVVRQCVIITVEAIIGDGYTLESDVELHVKRVVKSFDKMHFQKFLQDVITQLVIYGDAYAELVRQDGGLLDYARPLDAATIRIDYDEHGTPLKYIQRVLHRRVDFYADFYADEIAHLSINNIGGRPYGTSDLQAVLFPVQTKQAAQNYNNEFFRRPGMPRVIYTSKNLGKQENERIVASLKTVTPQSDLYFNTANGELDWDTVAPSNVDMQFVQLMEFLRAEIIAAMGVPPIFLGITEGSNRANSQTQMEAWDRKKKKLRLVIQDLINSQLLTTSNFGFDDVTFKFSDANSREELKYGQLMQLGSTIDWLRVNEVRALGGLPPLSEKKIIYNSATEAFNTYGDDIGDKLIFDIKQEQAEAKAQQDMAAQGLKNPNAANPMRNQKKEDNAQRLNSEQGNETRKFEKGHKTDYPFGAVEPEREVTDERLFSYMRARIQAIAEAQLRQQNNINYEYDEAIKPATSRPAPKTPPAAVPSEAPSGKAVFYQGKTQLDDN
jgi:HK97 family phage portal protein